MMQENSKKNGSSLIYVGNPDPGKQVDGGLRPQTPITMTSAAPKRDAPAAAHVIRWQMNSSFILPT